MKALSFPKNTWGSPGVTDVQIWHPSIFSLASCGLILFWKRQKRTLRNSHHQKKEHKNTVNKRSENISLLIEKIRIFHQAKKLSAVWATVLIASEAYSNNSSCKWYSLPWSFTYQLQDDDLPENLNASVCHTLPDLLAWFQSFSVSEFEIKLSSLIKFLYTFSVKMDFNSNRNIKKMQDSFSSNLVAMTPKVYLSSEMKASSVQSKKALISFPSTGKELRHSQNTFVICLVSVKQHTFRGEEKKKNRRENNLVPHWDKFQILLHLFSSWQSTLQNPAISDFL